MTKAKVPVSVVIPIKNEADNLPRCLQSVSWADEIYVVDSKSTDGSIEIAKTYGATVVQFEFNGVWPKKKNWALENLPFRNEWVFLIDADETVPPEAESEFREIVTSKTNIVGYWINRRFMFMGKWLKHAYYPNWNLRLFRHKLGRFERLAAGGTDSGDNEVHEHVLVDGATERLRVEMDHFAFPTVSSFVQKHDRYSNWEARVAIERRLGRTAPVQSNNVRFRRIVKTLTQKLPFRPTLRFLYVYILQFGFLDGREGYYFARLHGIYEFLCVVKTAELRAKVERD